MISALDPKEASSLENGGKEHKWISSVGSRRKSSWVTARKTFACPNSEFEMSRMRFRFDDDIDCGVVIYDGAH